MIDKLATGSALHALNRALALLDKTPDGLLYERMHPDVFDIATQFLITAGFAYRTCYPLIEREAPELPDTADRDTLKQILETALADITALSPADFEGAAARTITHQAGFAELTQDGMTYLTTFAIPNLWCHLTLAYSTLRTHGVGVGKADFDGLHAYPKGFSWKN